MNGWRQCTKTWWSVWSAGVIGLTVLAPKSQIAAQQPTVAAHTPADESANAQLSQRITIHLAKVPLKRAIDSVSRVANVFVGYELPLLKAQAATVPTVTVDASDQPLGVVLEQLLSGTTLRVVPLGGSLVLVSLTGSQADSVPGVGTVSGHVVDSATKKGLSGVTIKVAGTKLATLTQDDGSFTVRNVAAGQQQLMIKLFGYHPAERTVAVTAGQTTAIRVVLVTVPTVLSGVVTTATGQQRKVEVGNDITTVNADSVMRVAPVQTVTDLLETRVPGLTVVHSSGVPGAPSRLRLRGAGSASLNNDPIVIVDGIRVYASQSDARNNNLAPMPGSTDEYSAPSPLDQIDPNSIATIEVMKGPSATAIYGSDAGNGVIVITTKHGREGPTHWNLSATDGVTWLPGDWPTNYYRFGYNDHNQGPLCTWDDASCDVDSVVAFQALNNSRYSPFTHGNSQQANLSVSGGTSALTYSLTGSGGGNLGYLKLPASEIQRYDSLYGPISKSLERPDRYSTWGVNGSLKVVPDPTLIVTLQSSLFKSAQQQSTLQGSIIPLSAEYVSAASLQGQLISKEYTRVTDNALTSTNGASVHWQPRAWLPVDATGGINTMQRTDVTYLPFGIDNSLFGDGTDTSGYYGLGRGTTQDNTVTLATAIPLFRQKVTLSVGGNLQSESSADFHDYTDQLSPGVSSPSAFRIRCYNNGQPSICDAPSSQSSSGRTTYGWWLEPRLNVASKFFVTPGVRFDGGSGGSSSSSSGLSGLSTFPKMNLSYLLVDRQDERPLWGVLTQLRPRLAFGIGGTQPGLADKLRLLNVGLANYTLRGVGGTTSCDLGGNCIATADGSCSPFVTLDGVTQVPAVCVNSIGNTHLRPERSGEVEAGADVTLWQNRLSLTYTQFNKIRHDAILPIPVAPSITPSGLGTYKYQKNIGVIQNTGTELSMTATLLERRAIGWTLNMNYSQDNNKVVRLNRGQSTIVLNNTYGVNQTRVEAGYPVFGVFARPILAYADANQDGIIEPNEIRLGDSAVYVGQPNPKSQWSMSNDVSLFGGRLGVHAEFSYQNGMTQFNEGACNSKAFNLLPNTPGTSLATQSAVVAAGCGTQAIGDENGYVSGIGLIQVVNTLRFDYLTFNYAIPTSVSRSLRIPQMSIAVQGKNLGLHTNYHGFDPNVNAFSTAGSAGDQTVDTGQLPLQREWLFTVRLEN